MSLESYADRFSSIALTNRDGVVVMRLHTDDGPMSWSRVVHAELAECFGRLRDDPSIDVLIITGTGEMFSGPVVELGGSRRAMGEQDAEQWDGVFVEGRKLLTNLLDIEVPVIAAINGPALRHPEIPLLSDIVLVSERATVQDAAHVQGGLVSGDGVHVAFPLLMGPTRARYFLLTGQVLNAGQLLDFGLANEVLPDDRLLGRALELAEGLRQQPASVRRYSRLLLTEELKDRMRRLLGYGLALEGLSVWATNPRRGADSD